LRRTPIATLTGLSPYRDQSSNLLTSLGWADGILDLPTVLGAAGLTRLP
jgi:hypothetical protein